MNDEVKKYLEDILQSINAIDIHLRHQRNFSVYMNDITSKRAVEREIEIIGEAVNKAFKLDPDLQISYMRIIISMRNRVAHAYDSVDHVILWKVINNDLPLLKNEIEKLLKN